MQVVEVLPHFLYVLWVKRIIEHVIALPFLLVVDEGSYAIQVAVDILHYLFFGGLVLVQRQLMHLFVNILVEYIDSV